jgi:MoaA/NifB/PqqE/SkfB family radical SAM enzyme
MNVDWFITNRCDQAKYCKFCFAPWNFFPADASFARAMRLCERFQELHVDTVTICGGEPFKYPLLDRILQKLHECGINVVLYTSGTCNDYDVFELTPYVDVLSLPIDAVSLDVVGRMRGAHQFESISEILSRIKSLSKRPRVKIGTVVTRQNRHELGRIYRLITESEVVDIWRLYQFSPYGLGEKNKDLFLIDYAEFLSAVKRFKERGRLDNSNFLISERSREDNIGYCIIIDSVGNFYRYSERYIPIGMTIFDDPEEVIKKYDFKKNLEQKKWLKKEG